MNPDPTDAADATPHHLVDLRLRLGLTQAELSERLGINPSTISRAETGHPCRVPTYRRLAQFYGVHVMQLHEYRTMIADRSERIRRGRR